MWEWSVSRRMRVWLKRTKCKRGGAIGAIVEGKDAHRGVVHKLEARGGNYVIISLDLLNSHAVL